jgi:hypothetical protein
VLIPEGGVVTVNVAELAPFKVKSPVVFEVPTGSEAPEQPIHEVNVYVHPVHPAQALIFALFKSTFAAAQSTGGLPVKDGIGRIFGVNCCVLVTPQLSTDKFTVYENSVQPVLVKVGLKVFDELVEDGGVVLQEYT